MVTRRVTVLKEVAAKLLSGIRQSDVVGEEFLSFYPTPISK